MNPESIARQYFALSNARDLDTIETLLDPAIRYRSANTGEHEGREAVMTMMRAFFERFPTIHWSINALQSIAPDEVAITFTCQSVDRERQSVTRRGLERIRSRENLITSIEVESL